MPIPVLAQRITVLVQKGDQARAKADRKGWSPGHE